MKESLSLTVKVRKEGDMFVSFCPELDIASQGFSPEVALANLKEAVNAFVSAASHSEVDSRLKLIIVAEAGFARRLTRAG